MKALLIIVALFLALIAAPAEAKRQDLSWSWPTVDCDGDPLSLMDLNAAEIVVSTEPMPMQSDVAGPCAGPDGEAPTSASVFPVAMPDTLMSLNLTPGQTYYARIRVSAYVDGNWSAWSAEKQFTVPYGKPNIVILN